LARAGRAALNSADRAQWTSQVGADSLRAILGAAATLGYAANVPPGFDEGDLPQDLAPPPVDLGQFTLVSDPYYVTQPGPILDWYDAYGVWGGWLYGWGYFNADGGDFVTAGNYWYGDGWGYGLGFDQYAYGWGYGGYWGFGAGGWYGGWYGGWGYYPGYYGWNNWYAGYVPQPAGLSGDYQIDVDALLQDHADTLAEAKSPIETAQAIAIAGKDLTPLVVDPATAAGQLGDITEPPQAEEGGEGGGGAGFGEEPTTSGIKLVSETKPLGNRIESQAYLFRTHSTIDCHRSSSQRDELPIPSYSKAFAIPTESFLERSAGLPEPEIPAYKIPAVNVEEVVRLGLATWVGTPAREETHFYPFGPGMRNEYTIKTPADPYAYAVVADVVGDTIVTSVLERFSLATGSSGSRAVESFYRVVWRGEDLLTIDSPSVEQVASILKERRSQARASRTVETYVLDPQAISGLYRDAAVLTFALHLTPGGAASDEFSQGNNKEAWISLAGDLATFVGGELVFRTSRVELCGASICDARQHKQTWQILRQLARTRADGRFVALSGSELAEQIGCDAGQNGVAGCIRDFRRRVIDQLASESEIQCGLKDVIESGGAGYRLRDWIVVRDVTDVHDRGLQGHDDPDDPVNVPNDPANDPLKSHCDPVSGDDDPVNAESAARHQWIIDQLRAGRQLRAPAIAAGLKCSTITAKRDLAALRADGRVEFVGPSRTGYYRLATRARGSNPVACLDG
jgi:hypothetical protein